MDGPSAKKSTSFETLVIQNINNVNDLKAKLNEIISAGKNYEFDVSSCLKSLLKSNDESIVLLSVHAVSELVKCESKRETYAQKEIIEPILGILSKEFCIDKFELRKQCLRALGNLCCDCDVSRKIMLENNGVQILNNLLTNTLKVSEFDEIQILICKTLLNYAIGGQEFSDSLDKCGVVENGKNILIAELKKDDMNDDLVSTVLLLLSVINDNAPEFLYSDETNVNVLNVLKETTNVELSELCLEHLHSQVREHDSVKTLLAKEGGVQLVCVRLNQLLQRHEEGELSADDTQVEGIVKQACYLIILILTGDDAMPILYKDGVGEVYLTMVKWLDSPNHHLLGTALLAIGNFARQDDYCIQMMNDKIFDKLLDIFEVYHNLSLKQNSGETLPIEKSTLNQIQHASLSAIRNLSVPVANKRVSAAQGRAAPLLLKCLPNVDDHHVAYKLLAALRMLVDGQESVARLVSGNRAALQAIARWGGAGEHAGAAGEAPRLLAWTVRHVASERHGDMLQVEGCILNLVNMLIAPHSVMQNEAILALTLLAIEILNYKHTDEYEKNFTTHLIESEIGKHLSVLIETNCAKMPVEVAENLLAFLDVTSKCETILRDYNKAKVHSALQKLVDARKDFSEELKTCAFDIINKISDGSG
ncbi:rap1 GTPase-GDP dissociation stimulator 1-B [Zerene cesonia]|uniref:rap1 GTPase-GDP dissociation stimulator 1-B n=1 Tax=Zerene cesonia TaxID=33412 RepID=UPI0018E56B65|nr:rap1 GTPase-GDP dissociation stimulator 1-B [Zerene cesonia]